MSSGQILVTGATGFTGGHLCQRLAEDGHSVRALVRDPRRCDLLRDWGVELVAGDLRDRESVKRATRGVETLYHIGALFRPENVTRKDMWDTNVEGTRNMLDAAEECGVQRFVHCSTVGVYGHVKNPPANEQTPYRPGDYYQESKTEGEKLVLQRQSEQRLPIVVFQPGGIYGPRDLRFLKLLKAVKNRKFVMIGSGKVFYQMIYISDLVDGILLCGTCERAIGNTYILTGEQPVTLNELVRVVSEVLEVPQRRLRIPVLPVYLAAIGCELVCKPLKINPWLYRRRVDFFRKTRWFDISKARSELDFRPSTDLKTGIERTADWYRANGYL